MAFEPALHSVLVVGGDIRRSRELDDRAGLQRALEAALAAVNRRHADAVAVPLTVVQGDGFQGLLADPAAAVALLVDLELHLAPARFRAGLGWGTLSTPVRPSTASMDGPAFHHARAALESAHAGDGWLEVRGLGDALDEVAGGLCALLGAVRRGWSPSRRRAVAARRVHPTGKDAAADLGISASALSRALRAAHYRDVQRAEAALATLLRLAPGAADPRANGTEGAPLDRAPAPGGPP